MKKALISLVSTASLFCLSATAVLAQGDNTVEIGKPNVVSILDFGRLLSAIIGWIMIIAAIVFFFMLVIGGLQWIVSGGDKAQTEAARNRITAALVGLIIVFAAWAIMKLIESFLGVTILGGTIEFPKPY